MRLTNEKYAKSVNYDVGLVHLNHMEYLIKNSENRIIELARKLDNTKWESIDLIDDNFARYDRIMRDMTLESEQLQYLKRHYNMFKWEMINCRNKRK